MFVSFIFWCFFGYYLGKVTKHRYGTSESCCFCLPSSKKVAPEEETQEEEIVEDLEKVEPVDADTAKVPGTRIRKLTQSCAPAKKEDKPIVAVDDFSVAL